MRHLVLGVIGHVDHGKTALVRALTGQDTDRLPEEKRRGISIALGFAHAAIDGTEVDFIDMPGHERFVRTMVAGATGIDAVLLVVAANEGVAPQTVEHVDIAGLLGLKAGLVAVSKADLVAPEAAETVGEDARALMRGAGIEAPLALPTSSTTGAGLDALRRAIAALPGGATARADAGFAYLPIDRAFSLTGHGTVVTGTLRRGALSGDSTEMELAPTGAPIRFRRLHVHGKSVPSAEPGQRVAANLRGIQPDDIPRGAAIVPGGLLRPTSWLAIEIHAVSGAPPLATTQRLQLLYGTDEVEVRLRLLDRDALGPGDTALAQLRTARPIWVPSRERIVLRIASPAQTVAGGVILDAETTRLRRNAPGVLSRLAALARATPDEVVAAEPERAGPGGIDIGRLARLAGYGPGKVRERLADLRVIVDRQGVVASRAAFESLLARIPAIVQDHGPGGATREQLLAHLPATAPSLIEEAALRLAGGGTLRHEAGRFRPPASPEEDVQAMREIAAAARLAEEVRLAGLKPPDLLQDSKARPLVERLLRQGVLIRTRDQAHKRDIVFHREAVEDAKARLAGLILDGPGVLVAEVGAALGISRKYSLPLLEYLDAVHFTRRVEDRRVLHRQADRAGAPPRSDLG